MAEIACPTCKSPVPADAPGGACPRCLMALAFATDAGGLAPDASPAEVEQRFAGYEVLGTIGRGGMGTVFRARQKALDREVALKVLPGGPGRPAGFTERFAREAKALARLQHPGIVQVFDFGTSDDGWCYLAMELVEGVNLRRALADGRLAAKQALAIVPQICDALQYAHDHGVVHRDIKPENLLLTKDGRVKVADFGLAKLVQDARIASLTHTGHSMGTPLYMAPEQVEHPADVDHRADIYSLGVVFYEMLTGELPIGRFAAPSKKSDVDARIDDIVLRTLEKEREARFQRADEVKTRIDEAGGPASPPAPAGSPPRVRVVDAAAEKTLELQQALFTSRGSGSKVSKFALLIPVAAFIACCIVEGNSHSVSQSWMFTAPSIAVLLVASLIAWGRIRRSAGAMHGIGYAGIGALTALVLVPVTIIMVAKFPHSTWPAPVAVVDPVAYERRSAAFKRDQTAIRNLVQRAMALRPVTKLDALRDFYTAADFSVLAAMDEEDRLARGAAGQLGLPMMSDDFLEGIVSSSELVMQDATPTDEGTAVVSLFNSSLMSISVHCVRDDTTTGMSAENGGPQEDASKPRWRFALVPLGKYIYANSEVQRRLRRPPGSATRDGTLRGPATPPPPPK